MDRPYTSIDLIWLTRRLHALFAGDSPVGSIVGRTKLRDAVITELDCSELEAESLIDTLVAQRWLVFEQGPESPGRWLFKDGP
jgi:hypothetical protein